MGGVWSGRGVQALGPTMHPMVLLIGTGVKSDDDEMTVRES